MIHKLRLFSALVLLFLQDGAFLFAQNLMQYTSGEYNYSILIPEDWKRNDELRNSQISLVLVSDKGAAVFVSFYSLNQSSEELFIDQFEKSLPSQLEGLSIQEKGVIRTREDEVVYLIYEYKKQGADQREKVCFYRREKEMALVTASQTASEFHENLPVFDKIFQSFTFETDQEKVESSD